MKSDLDIQQDVINELKWQPFLRASNIGVSVKDGIVTLSGVVDTYAQKIDAEKATKKVAGVKAIAEDIQIGVSTAANTDTEIAKAILKALKSHTAVPEERIKLKVENGIVTLEGEVDWDYQRHSARNAITGLSGVRKIISLISVKPKTIAIDVKKKITEALQRAAAVDADKITVEAIDGKVILRGTVRSFTEKEDAEDAVWCAPGVSAVQNLLAVESEKVYSF